MPTVKSADGVSLAAYDLGGDGPPVLFAHATGFHAHVWLPIVEVLSDRFHCYGVDSRGHGNSEMGTDDSWRTWSADTVAVVRHFGLDRPFAVGHSSGASLLLMGEQDNPGTFRALYCYEPVMMPTDEPLPPGSPNPLEEGARRRREVFPSFDDARANYAAKPPLNALTSAALDAYVRYGFEEVSDGVRLKCRGENEARMYAGTLVHDAFRRLGEVACPVTYACGERTDAMGTAAVEAMAARTPSARAEVLPELGHFGPLQDPRAIAERIAAAFL